MVDDHTKADDDLKQLATRENVTVPTSMSREDEKEVDRLSKLHGAKDIHAQRGSATSGAGRRSD
jgi:putative membrane protein